MVESGSVSAYYTTPGNKGNRGGYEHPLPRVRVTEEVWQRLAKVGKKEGLSYSDTVRLVLERGLRASEAQ